jgi:hypothetical protein
MIDGIPAKTQNKHLPNMRQGHLCYINQLSGRKIKEKEKTVL